MAVPAPYVPDPWRAVLGHNAQAPSLAPVAAFVAWLRQIGETDGMSRQHLLNLYTEFCEFEDQHPLSEAKLLRRARAAGIQRYREPTGRRRWRYQVKSSDLEPIAMRRAAL